MQRSHVTKFQIFRVWFSLALLTLISVAFLGHHQLSQYLSNILIQLQFVPALIKLLTGTGFLFLVIIVITLIFGRAYCSFLCPLGIFQDVMIRLSFKLGIIRKHRPQIWLSGIQHALLGLTLLTLIYGSFAMVNLLDPYTIYGKFMVSLIKPIAIFMNNILVDLLEYFDIYAVSIKRANEIPLDILALTWIFFLLVSCLAIFGGRLYCNAICPVGLLLAKLAQFSIFKFRIDAEKCQQCQRCADVCKAGCIDIRTLSIDDGRCVTCFNCLAACDKDLISYQPPIESNCRHPVPVKRQFLLDAFLAGGVLLSAYTPFRIGQWGFPEEKRPVLPPGAINIHHFTRTCTACHLCISACPTHVMRPTLTGYGLPAIMLPRLVFQKAHCDIACNACGKVCPTGAIAPLLLKEKKRVRIGTASLNKSLCVVHVKKKHCGACGEACPTHAIFPIENQQVIFPEINLDYCIGCGACEHACPTSPKAIEVTAIPAHESASRYKPRKKRPLNTPPPSKEFPF